MTGAKGAGMPSPTNAEYAAITQWMTGRDTGMSSKALAAAALGQEAEDDAFPWDPADLGRCLRLIRAVPFVEARGLPALAGRCSVWRQYAAHWDELRQLMSDEVGLDWEKAHAAPKTYDRMQTLQVLAGVA